GAIQVNAPSVCAASARACNPGASMPSSLVSKIFIPSSYIIIAGEWWWRGSDMHPWILAEQTHAFIRSQRWEVAVLAFGATEPHNLHMPYGTDNFQVEEVGKRACEKAYNAGAKVLLLPTMPFGVNTNHLEVPGGLALSVNPTTLLHVITDLVE